MIKWIFVGIWMPLATVASGYCTQYWLNDQMAKGATQQARLGGLDYETVQPVNVPILKDGALQGYVVANLVFTADADVLRSLSVPPHPFLVDEAFRLLYADKALDFKHLERYDLDGMTRHLRLAVNARIGDDVVKEVLVEEFNYFTRADVITH